MCGSSEYTCGPNIRRARLRIRPHNYRLRMPSWDPTQLLQEAPAMNNRGTLLGLLSDSGGRRHLVSEPLRRRADIYKLRSLDQSA
jgi:hypothetical protein